MDLATVLSILAVVAAIGFPLLARRDLLTTLKARDEIREEWRKQVNADIEALKKSASITELALLTQSVEVLAASVKDLWKYTTDLKHLHIDPYEREVSKLRGSVDKLERQP